MKKWFSSTIFLAAFLIAFFILQKFIFYPKDNYPADFRFPVQDSLNYQRHNAITRAVEKVMPAVVGINVTQVKEYSISPSIRDDPFYSFLFRNHPVYKEVNSLGSGFLISNVGYILTNEHVVHKARSIIVTMADGRQFSADILDSDYKSDIAVLKIKGNDFPYLEMGDSEDIIPGEWVIALGNPYGLFAINSNPSVSVGVVSATNRDFGKQDDNRVYNDMIQTDAAINPGNSGGALVNTQGKVIGMNTVVYTGGGAGSIGINFAIPINRIRKILRDIIEEGGVNRNYWTGLVGENLNSYMIVALNLPVDNGVLITEVIPDSPADEAGIQEGDVIIRIADKKVQTRDDIISYLLNIDAQVGDVFNFTILRDARKTLDFPIELKEKPMNTTNSGG